MRINFKNKYIYLNFMLLLLVFIVGFSPQINETSNLFSSVYANEVATATSGTFDSTLSGMLGDLAGEGGIPELESNIKASMKSLGDVFTSVSTALKGFALALSTAIIALAGFKFMSSSGGSLTSFLKNRKDVSNSLICVVFIVAIPYFANGVLNLNLSQGFIQNSSNESSAQNIGDIKVNTKSYAASVILKQCNVSPDDTVSPESNPYRNTKGLDLSKPKEESNGGWSAIKNLIIDAVLTLLTEVIYVPINLIATLIGFISFYPMSFDVDMYSTAMSQIVGQSVPVAESTLAGFVGVDTSKTGEALAALLVPSLKMMAQITNLLYYIIKKFCMLGIEVLCYFYGISHLLGKDTANVGRFLVRFFEGLVGMLLAPHLIEFMLDIDAMVSSAILEIAQKGLPGLGLLSILPSKDAATASFINLTFAIAMSVLIAYMAKAFFVRRIEITLYYLACPVVFLKHMWKDEAQISSRWLKTMTSAVFLPTMYSPLFVLVTLLALLGQAVTDNYLASLLYYMLIMATIWVGHPIISGILALFSPGMSMSTMTARSRLGEGINGVPNAVKSVGSAAVTVGAAVATGGASLVGTAASMGSAVKRDGFADAAKTGFKNVGNLAINPIKGAVFDFKSNLAERSVEGKLERSNEKLHQKQMNYERESFKASKRGLEDNNSVRNDELTSLKKSNSPLEVDNRVEARDKKVNVEANAIAIAAASSDIIGNKDTASKNVNLQSSFNVSLESASDVNDMFDNMKTNIENLSGGELSGTDKLVLDAIEATKLINTEAITSLSTIVGRGDIADAVDGVNQKETCDIIKQFPELILGIKTNMDKLQSDMSSMDPTSKEYGKKARAFESEKTQLERLGQRFGVESYVSSKRDINSSEKEAARELEAYSKSGALSDKKKEQLIKTNKDYHKAMETKIVSTASTDKKDSSSDMINPNSVSPNTGGKK